MRLRDSKSAEVYPSWGFDPLPASRTLESLHSGLRLTWTRVALAMPETMAIPFFQPCHCVFNVGLGDDCVSLKHSASTPTPDFHDYALRKPFNHQRASLSSVEPCVLYPLSLQVLL